MYRKIINAQDLYLIRHAEPQKHTGFVSDKYSPLTDEGKEKAYNKGRELVRQGIIPTTILSSSLRRAEETTEYLLLGIQAEGYTSPRIESRDWLREINVGSYPKFIDIARAFPTFNRLYEFFVPTAQATHREDIPKTLDRVAIHKDELTEYSGVVFVVGHAVLNECLYANLTEHRWNPLNFNVPFLDTKHLKYNDALARWVKYSKW